MTLCCCIAGHVALECARQMGELHVSVEGEGKQKRYFLACPAACTQFRAAAQLQFVL